MDETHRETARRVALDAATEQFGRMPSSNPWDIAKAVLRALAAADLLITDEMRSVLDASLALLDEEVGEGATITTLRPFAPLIEASIAYDATRRVNV